MSDQVIFNMSDLRKEAARNAKDVDVLLNRLKNKQRTKEPEAKEKP